MGSGVTHEKYTTAIARLRSGRRGEGDASRVIWAVMLQGNKCGNTTEVLQVVDDAYPKS